jgi:TPR repeat protein
MVSYQRFTLGKSASSTLWRSWGCADGQFQLGKMYEASRGGLAQDDAEALSWYRKAAEQGSAEAQEVLRRMEAAPSV